MKESFFRLKSQFTEEIIFKKNSDFKDRKIKLKVSHKLEIKNIDETSSNVKLIFSIFTEEELAESPFFISKFSEIQKIKIEKAELGRKLDVIFDFYKNIPGKESKIFDYNVIKCLGSYRKNLMGSLDLFSESNLTLSNKVIYSVKENICIGKFEIIDEGGKNE